MFDKPDIMDWKTFSTKFQSLSDTEVSELKTVFGNNYLLETRKAMLLLRSRSGLQSLKFEENEMKAFMKRGGSVPVLSEIYDLLRLGQDNLKWNELEEDAVRKIWQQLLRLMLGGIQISSPRNFLQVTNYAWNISPTREYLLKYTDFGYHFGKLFGLFRDKFTDNVKTLREWSGSKTFQVPQDILEQDLTAAEIMTCQHVGLSWETLAEFKFYYSIPVSWFGRSRPQKVCLEKVAEKFKNSWKVLEDFFNFFGIKLIDESKQPKKKRPSATQ
ncbi:hypothetical protein CROQUDRAFT_395477 [Cronartium quercuum f. sp. fusiforme G11]|uniref:Uncharacterized protein n=1 Tax=Cronartium quercuum f. sp. fusiforme G11 TaxID=708437 RepID=A0A9P6T5X0_9BASI|nr:hypothetical protein CROQUDRAFT_395477 [Cronartium quercuum f. sp. fusiforme G11]